MMECSEKTAEIAKGLQKFRAQLKQPFKDADNPFFKSKYVPLENVVEVIDRALVGTGLSYTQEVTSDPNGVSVSTQLWHEQGGCVRFCPLTLPATKKDAQGFGSAVTYARRYSLSVIFGITSEQDDDGNEAAKTTPQRIDGKMKNNLTTMIAKLAEEKETSYDITLQTIQKRTKIDKDTDELTNEEYGVWMNFIASVRNDNDKQKKKPSERLPKGTEKQETLL